MTKDSNMIEFKYLDLLKLRGVQDFSSQNAHPNFSEQFGKDNVIKHILIDDFLKENYARLIASEHEEIPQKYWIDYSHNNQVKTGITDRSLMGRNTQSLIEELSSASFIGWLSGLTGLKDMFVDPELDRAGLHRTEKNGFLSIHTEEESPPKHKHWKRRITLLVYLSTDYEKSWGGNLELWDYKNRRMIQSISPEFNRCVIFANSDNDYHGHPSPLNCPENSARRSLALYYYQKTKEANRITTTRYVSTPNDRITKRFLTRFNRFVLYIYAVLKRYTKLDDDSMNKVSSYFSKRYIKKNKLKK